MRLPASLPVRAALLLAGVALSFSACGSRKSLKAVPGMEPTPVAHGAEKPATPDDMLKTGPQARPDRSAEPLLRSQERAEDPFNLPPSR